MAERNLNFDEIVERRGTDCLKYDFAKRRGKPADVLPLWVADMDFRLPDEILDEFHKRIDHGIFGYTDPLDEYFAAMNHWFSTRYGYTIEPEWVTLGAGIVYALGTSVRAFTEEGDAMMVMQPVYYPFREVIEDNGRIFVNNQLHYEDGKYTIDFEDFEKQVKDPAVKLFILCNPHNPLGRVWSQDELSKMLTLCFENDVQVVSDEIHSDLIFHGKKHIPAAIVVPEAADKVITCISVTKTFNLAGLQASTTVFPNLEMKKKFDGYWGGMDIHRNNAFSSVAMEAALNEGEEWLEQLLAYISGNLDYICDYFEKKIPLIKANMPDATYLVWLDCRALHMDNEELKDFMIHKAGLGLNDGSSFTRTMNGFMRLNAACPRAVLEKALKQLEDAVNSLNN